MVTKNSINANASGLVVFDATTGTFQGRTMQQGTGFTITNADGISGNPTLNASSGSVNTVITKFTASGTWTKNANSKWVQLYIWGGGGGGSSGMTTAPFSEPGAGAGGGVAFYSLEASRFGSSETVTVGAQANGGAAVAAGNPANPGTVGNNSSVGSFVAMGGGGGNGGSGGSGRNPISNYSASTPSNTSNGASQGNGSADNITACMMPTGGGAGQIQGGSIFTAGNILDPAGTIIINKGTQGTSGSRPGGNGNNALSTNYFVLGGTGGGGGYGDISGTAGGKGGDGGIPGGGGGGGGAANGGSSGAGGKGARGEVWIIEYLS